ncbi:MAG: hypothetical protein L0Z54_05640 [Thermoplasmata archaeon]|nr:hypothetical protein [Thermoplasmata archaeon]
MPAVTIDTLTRAIQKSIPEHPFEYDEAKKLAEHMMNFFGYGNRIIDNILEPEDRDLFYMMEDSGILTTDREETTLHDGREWRIHYWTFHAEKIEGLIRNHPIEPAAPDVNVYEALFSDDRIYSEMFTRRNGDGPAHEE